VNKLIATDRWWSTNNLASKVIGELHNSHSEADNVHTALHVHSTNFHVREKLYLIAAVVLQVWSPSPRESRVFRPQHRGNTMENAVILPLSLPGHSLIETIDSVCEKVIGCVDDIHTRAMLCPLLQRYITGGVWVPAGDGRGWYPTTECDDGVPPSRADTTECH